MDDRAERDAKVRKISRLLEKGGTMLAKHCEVCGAPLFRYRGEVICPVCMDADSDNSMQQVQITTHNAPQKMNGGGAPEVIKLLEEKLLELTRELHQEDDKKKMLDTIEVMKELTNLIASVKGKEKV